MDVAFESRKTNAAELAPVVAVAVEGSPDRRAVVVADPVATIADPSRSRVAAPGAVHVALVTPVQSQGMQLLSLGHAPGKIYMKLVRGAALSLHLTPRKHSSCCNSVVRNSELY